MRQERENLDECRAPVKRSSEQQPCSPTESMTDGLSRVSAAASLAPPVWDRPRIGGNARTRGLSHYVNARGLLHRTMEQRKAADTA